MMVFASRPIRVSEFQRSRVFYTRRYLLVMVLPPQCLIINTSQKNKPKERVRREFLRLVFKPNQSFHSFILIPPISSIPLYPSLQHLFSYFLFFLLHFLFFISYIYTSNAEDEEEEECGSEACGSSLLSIILIDPNCL